jgi:tetratricopeptide (TPR) repeat protein
MKKRTNTEPVDPDLAEKQQALLDLTGAFCDARLNADYKRLCQKMIDEMARMRPVPFARGRADIWAAGIVHAIGGANFLFDKSFEPYLSAGDIAAGFGVSPASASQKAAAVRDLFDLSPLGTEFQTKQMKERFAPTREMMAQMSALLASLPGADDDDEDDDEDSEGEFIDDDHAVMGRFYDLGERYAQSGPTPAIESALRKMIVQDPDFYDSYLMLRDLLRRTNRADEGEALLETAHARALARITDANENWPRALDWGWLENRHIIRTFLNQAIARWQAGDTDAALGLLRNLLRSCPNDNVGARDYLLAVRLGMTFDEFERTFKTGLGCLGYDAAKMWDWFDENSSRFPDEFDEWKQAVGYETPPKPAPRRVARSRARTSR